jgi:hypothetical protein
MNRTIRKQVILIIAITSIAMNVLGAAGKYSIKGKVVDAETKQPVEFASVVLLSLPDSTIKGSALTDPQGNYSFANIAEGTFIVKAQLVGYKPNLSGRFTSAPNANVADIAIKPSAVIKEVTVVGKKPYIEKKADRTVLNIESSATASAESAYEVLKKAPNINIDKDDNININGKQGVTVMINDRPTHLSGTDLANYLKSVQGGEIEKVEIINNPPARYEAAGNTGIINIRTKRSFKPGLNGSVNGGMTYNGKVGASGGINLNVRNGKTNVYANYNPGSYAGKSSNKMNRRIGSDDKLLVLDQKTNGSWRYNSNSFKAGVDYDINKKNTIGVMVSGYGNSNTRNMKGTTYFIGNKTLPDSSLFSSNPTDGTFRNMSYNLNYKSVLDTNGRELNVDVDYAHFNNDSDANNDAFYYNASGTQSRTPKLLKSEAPSEITIKSAKVDYVHPLGKIFRLETGAKASTVKTDNNLKYYTSNSSGWSFDPTRSNHFIYDEDVAAGYVSLSFDKNSTSVKGGLRVEHTWSKGNSITTNKVVKRSYTDLFPTFFIQQKLDEKSSIGFSYNRRIDRPEYEQLNPFLFYVDEYTYREGNPFLDPQYTHNLSANYSWNNMIFTEVTYSYTTDVMAETLQQNDATKVIKQVPMNLSSLSSLTFNGSINLNPTKWWRSNSNISVYNNSYKRTDDNQSQTNSKLTAYASSTNSFMLPKSFTLELMGWYQTPGVFGMFQMKDMYSVNLGVQKSFLAGKARVKVSFDDIFNSMKNRVTSKYDNVNFRALNSWSSQKVGISFSYRFGKDDLKPSRQRRSGLDDESRRIGGGNK